MDGRRTGAAAHHWLAGQWMADGTMESVAEINAQCLEFLGTLVVAPVHGMAQFARNLTVLPGLSDAARLHLAASPYLLADAGFDDETRWRAMQQHMVHDLPYAHGAPVFVGRGSQDFVRQVLVLGWHLARANRQLARVVLGMTPECAARVATLRLQDLDWLAVHCPGWVRPRWEKQPRIWRHLLLAARDQDQEQLTQVSLRGIQLMAAVVLGTESARAAPALNSGL